MSGFKGKLAQEATMAETVIKTVPRGRGELLRSLTIGLLQIPVYRSVLYAGQLVAILMAAHYENDDSDIRRAALDRATKLLDDARSDPVVAEVIAVSFPREDIGRRALAQFIALSDKGDARMRSIAAGITVVD